MNDLWRRKLSSIPKTIKFTLAAIDFPPMQLCTLYLGASHGDGLRQLVTPGTILKRIQYELDIYIFFFDATINLQRRKYVITKNLKIKLK